ncbi:MAG: 50S ribosomal protein L11 [Candidatus Bathyarchaeia archaeon]
MPAEKKTLEFIVDGGKATAGPPIGPAIGPLGVNVVAVVNKINELTKEYVGMRVPVKVTIDPETKSFEVEVGIPTTSALIFKEAGVEKGSGKPNAEKIGNLAMEQVIKIAKIKRSELLAKTLRAAVKEIIGSCVSMGITVEGKDPKVVLREIDAGKYDELIKKAGEAK